MFLWMRFLLADYWIRILEGLGVELSLETSLQRSYRKLRRKAIE